MFSSSFLRPFEDGIIEIHLDHRRKYSDLDSLKRILTGVVRMMTRLLRPHQISSVSCLASSDLPSLGQRGADVSAHCPDVSGRLMTRSQSCRYPGPDHL